MPPLKLTTAVAQDHVLRIRLPDDFPVGPVEVTIVPAAADPAADAAFERRFPRIAELADGAAILDDPTAPLDDSDWGGL